MYTSSHLPSTFTLFSQLPPEIRLQIWDTALETSQCLELRCLKYTSHNKYDYYWHWYSPSPIPALLHVCYESRVEALRYYQAHYLNINHNISYRSGTLQNRLLYHQDRPHREGMIYLNTEKDTVVIQFPSAHESTTQFNISTANLACADLIQNLGISSHQVSVQRLLDIYGMQLFLSPFRNIRKLFQFEITSKENEEQQLRVAMEIPGIYTTRYIDEAAGGLLARRRRRSLKMVEIGMNFPQSSRFWFHALLKRALENLRERDGTVVCTVIVMGSEEMRDNGGLKPWYCFVQERVLLNSNRLLV